MEDKLYFLFVFFAVVVIAAAGALIYTPMHATLSGLGTAPAAALDNIEPNDVYNWVDYTIIFFYFGVNILVCIVLPMTIRANPIAIAALFIFSFIYALIVAYIANAAVEFLESVGSQYTLTLMVLQNLVIIEVVFLLIMAIVMFFKYRLGQDSYYYG